MIKKIKHQITKEMAQQALIVLEAVLGKEEIRDKFSGMVFDLDYAAIRDSVFTMAQIYSVAERYGIKDNILAELRKIESVWVGGKYSELVERYLGLLIVEVEFPSVSQALPEHKVLDEANPDWTLRTEHGAEFYLEVSAIQIQKVFDDLIAFRTRIPAERIVRSNVEPLYFEIIFPDNPRNYDPAIIGRRIADAGRNLQLPVTVQYCDIHIFVDFLKNRYQRQQITSDAMLDKKLLKLFHITNHRLAYTIAVQPVLRTLEDKIRAKKQQNRSRQIGNMYLCIWVNSGEFAKISNDIQMAGRLRDRISKSKWLKGVLICTLFHDTSGRWEIQYVKIGDVIES